jgi:hypothetical protein
VEQAAGRVNITTVKTAAAIPEDAFTEANTPSVTLHWTFNSTLVTPPEARSAKLSVKTRMYSFGLNEMLNDQNGGHTVGGTTAAGVVLAWCNGPTAATTKTVKGEKGEKDSVVPDQVRNNHARFCEIITLFNSFFLPCLRLALPGQLFIPSVSASCLSWLVLSRSHLSYLASAFASKRSPLSLPILFSSFFPFLTIGGETVACAL